ncbi:Pentatricopeptide repeat-containing protein [Apostasia shenzhenica]|uniref:Pentatricopeptide repeat-containing protein n=1 Tax=Apostasia shenzhenica TaxID=1088818 RepID=A0A2I0BCD9_9ASPA|nr:Pentatricopeptide repeat-containing protein [Apostasia shenzhenica]
MLLCRLKQQALLLHRSPTAALITRQLFHEIPATTSALPPPVVQPLTPIRARLRSGVGVDLAAATWALKSSRELKTGSQLHAIAVSSGLFSFLAVSNSLMCFYSKSGHFESALVVFASIPNPDVVSWNTILCGFDSCVDALRFAQRMRHAGVLLDPVTLTIVISFSGDLQDISVVHQLHSLALKSGFDSDVFVSNALITAYGRHECIESARKVFDEMLMRDLVSWNAMISGLTQEGSCADEAIEVFVRMVGDEGLRPDHISFSSAIAACVQNSDLQLGSQIHGFAAKVGLKTHILVSNVLMSLYYKCRCEDSATIVFHEMRNRNVVSWTTMISIDLSNAVLLFNSMRIDDIQPNDVTFVTLIYALSPQHSIKEGEMIHGICFKTRFSTEVNVSNSLINLYAKLGSMEDARKIFDDMEIKEIISWNSLISGYAQNGLCEEAILSFSSAAIHSKPNQYTFASVISAITSAQTVYLSYGHRLHCCIIKLGLNTDEYVAGALVDLYAKRGSIVESQLVFDEPFRKSLISWSAIISAHAKHGNYEIVMKLFEEMVNSSILPDHITILAVLTACCSCGMITMGRQIFDSMIGEYKLDPWPEHYACIVDLLGKAGKLADAEEFLMKIPNGPGVSALQSLLGACRIHGDLELGKRVAEALMEKEPMESGAYVLMSNMYANNGDWENAARVRRWMRDKGVKKEVAFSWVDAGIGDSLFMHKFASDDNTHPLAEQIYGVAESLGSEMMVLEEDELMAA